MDNILEYYLQEHTTENFLVPSDQAMSRFFRGLRMEVEQNMGRGWSEILYIHKGLYVETSDFRLKHRMETRGNMQPPLYLSILLSGHCEFQIPGRERISARFPLACPRRWWNPGWVPPAAVPARGWKNSCLPQEPVGRSSRRFLW